MAEVRSHHQLGYMLAEKGGHPMAMPPRHELPIPVLRPCAEKQPANTGRVLLCGVWP